MYRQPAIHFGDMQKALASAMHASGSTDTEIGLELGVSVNNIIYWRREAGLPENRPGAETPPAPPPAGPARGVATAPRDTPADFGYEGIPATSAKPTPVLLSAVEAQAVFHQPVQPTAENALEIGTGLGGQAFVDLEELRMTRLLVQGNSGSGKSHLLRKLIEESKGLIQQVIIDPEGDFVSLGETFGHTVINAAQFTEGKIFGIAGRARQHRGSVVLNLEDMEAEGQMSVVAAFLNGMFDAPREHWFPALVFVDEAQLFAPIADHGEDKEIRKRSLGAMTNLMCRGRKRGLAGILATQRIAKLNKNVAAECSNFLMGRTFLDIDIARAAELVGLQPRQAEAVRDLARGEFLGLGPAISKRPLKIKVGSVITEGKAGPEQGLAPLPAMAPEDMEALMLADIDDQPAPALRLVR